MVSIYQNDFFEELAIIDIKNWIKLNKSSLVGSAIFTKNNSITSKIVRWAEHFKCADKSFCPSHTGSIIELENELFIFDMKPLKATITPLYEYLLNTEDDFVIVIRDFELNTKMFSLNVAEHIGEFYPFLSAIRSVGTKFNSKWRRHCSELHLRELQKQGIWMDLNPEITPDELYHVLKN